MKKKKTEKPTAIDLFAGAGGLTVGLKQAGFKVVAAVEMDKKAVATYRANHRSAKIWQKDIRDINCLSVKRALSIRKGELDLLAGCPPCQGYSTLRTLNGRKSNQDKRNDLIFEFLRFVKEFMPKAVMMENVPGLANDKRFRRFLREMKSLGYEGHYRILNTAEFRVPQRRRRLIYIAGRGCSISFGAKARTMVTVRDAIGRLPSPGGSGDPAHDVTERRSDHVMKIIRHIPHDGGSRSSLPIELQLECHKRSNGFKDVYGRMAWDKPSPTITSGCFNPSKGRFLHPEQDRTITIREAALLQTFPEKYKFIPSDNKQAMALMVGNALPPEFIRRHALAIKSALN